jgi:hypothetical protein
VLEDNAPLPKRWCIESFLTHYRCKNILFLVIARASFLTQLKLRLPPTICRVRFVFWRIKMSAGAIIHCRFVKKKFQM